MEVLSLRPLVIILLVLCLQTWTQRMTDSSIVNFVRNAVLQEIGKNPLLSNPLNVARSPQLTTNAHNRNAANVPLGRSRNDFMSIINSVGNMFGPNSGIQFGSNPRPISSNRFRQGRRNRFTSVNMLANFNHEDRKVRNMRKYAHVSLTASKKLVGMFRAPFETYSNDRRVQEGFREAFNCTDNPLVTCNTKSRFRTIDGSCNNLQNPRWGMSFTPQARYLVPDYDDGFDSPRSKSVLGGTLPSAREISNKVLRSKPKNGSTDLSIEHTMMLMAWGQFLDHDLTFTPTPTEEGDITVNCCKDTNIDCFPIDIPPGDERFNTTTCMHFIRSSPALENPCVPGPRQQVNQLTSFIDASNVYGSTKIESDSLRSFMGGKLLVNENNLPPADDPSVCQLRPGDYCMKAGDQRINEVVHLGAMHIVFLRYHNKIAGKLAKLNEHWDDERIFQETRRIIGAILQKITYEDYIPIMLNQRERRKFCLNSSPFCEYDPMVNPAIKNSFSTAALRVGHSMVGPFEAYFSRNFRTLTNKTKIELTMNKPHFVLFNNGTRLPDLMRWVCTSKSAKTDSFLEPGLRNNLFLDDNGDSLDLGALNIQRGRDHGLPPYIKWREFCGLSTVYQFSHLKDHSCQAISRLMNVYRHPGDIDLFAGALSETPLQNSQVGPTFSCILGNQFRDLKRGDRFWFESKDRRTGLSRRQIRAIKKITLSKIICETMATSRIQENIFQLLSCRNRLLRCKNILKLNLNPWRYSHRDKHFKWTSESNSFYWTN